MHNLPPGETLTVIVELTKACNLKCPFCSESVDDYLNYKAIKDLHRLLLRDYSKRNFIIGWYGGEPLLMGGDFFQKIARLQEHLGMSKRIINLIQTNALLLGVSEIATFEHMPNFRISANAYLPSILGDDRFTQKQAHDDIQRMDNLFDAAKAGLLRHVNIPVIRSILSSPEKCYKLISRLGVPATLLPCIYAFACKAGYLR